MTEQTKPPEVGGDKPQDKSTAAKTAEAPAPARTGNTLQEGRLFNFYRPDEGHKSRAVIGIGIATLLLYGCHQLFGWLPWHERITELLGSEFEISGASITTVVLGIAVLAGIYWLVNWPKFVDFLIDTENELKKVSWASKNQVISESIVVVVTVLILGTYIFLIDSALILIKKLDWASFWDKILG